MRSSVDSRTEEEARKQRKSVENRRLRSPGVDGAAAAARSVDGMVLGAEIRGVAEQSNHGRLHRDETGIDDVMGQLACYAELVVAAL